MLQKLNTHSECSISLNTELPQDSSEAQGGLTNRSPCEYEMRNPCSKAPFPGFAKQCVAGPRKEDQRVSTGINSPDSMLHQVESDSKSYLNILSNMRISLQEDDLDHVLQNEVALIRSRCNVRGGAATIKDFGGDFPEYLEVSNLLKIKSRTTSSKIIRLQQLFVEVKTEKYVAGKTEKWVLTSEANNLWLVAVDLYRTAILYGYSVSKSTLRLEMLKTWLYYINHVIQFPEYKEINTISKDGDNLSLKFNYSRWIKVVKYKLAAFASWAKDSDVLPENPLKLDDNPWFLISKKFQTFLIKNKRVDDTRKGFWYMSLIDSLCRGVKKGAPRSSKEDCVINEIETFNLFVNQKPHIKKFEHKDLPVLTTVDINAEIVRSVDEILGEEIFTPEFTHCPSFSSCTEVSLKEGGHVKAVKAHIGPMKDKMKFAYAKKIGMARGQIIYNNSLDLTENPDPEVTHSSLVEDEFEGGLRSTEYVEVDVNPLQAGSDIDIEHLSQVCLSKPTVIKPIGLSEALKVRGITTPSGLESWLLKPLQKFLFNCIKKFDVFKVTSTPLTHEHLEKVIRSLHVDQKFVSGDYDNATNNMYASATLACITAICDKLNIQGSYREVVIRSLVGNLVKYELIYEEYNGIIGIFNDTKGGKLNRKKLILEAFQQEAQPMGKILSFSVLCIINFAVCRKSVELDSNSIIPINKFPGLINGDDCCFPIRDFDIWVKIAAMVGLFNSIGKTFYSRKFIEMNSRTFLAQYQEVDVKESLRNLNPLIADCIYTDYCNGVNNCRSLATVFDITFVEVPFINFGLLKGMVRSSSSELEGTKTQKRDVVEAVSRMGWCHHQLMDGFGFMWEELDYLFKYHHNKFLLSNYIYGLPYYIPCWLGGLGLKPSKTPSNQIDTNQRLCASYIFQRIEKMKPKSITLEKNCLINDIYQRTINNIYKEFNIKDVEIDYKTLTNFEESEVYDLADDNLCIYNFMVERIWRNLRLDEFFIDLDENFVMQSSKIGAKKLLHNCDIWKKAFNIIKKDPSREFPLPWYKIWHFKRKGLEPLVLLREDKRNERMINSFLELYK